MKLHRVLALTVLFAVLASLGLRPAFAAAPSDQAGLVLLTAPTTPELRALAARFPSRPAPLAADARAARAALSRARALVADVGALSADLIRRSQWFAQAHALGVPIVLAHADAERMTAVTGMGSGGDLVVLRPSPGGREVAVHVVLSHEYGAGARPDSRQLADAAAALLAAPAADDPVPNPDLLPRRAVRVWDVITSSPREFLPKPYEFPLTAGQTILDDVRFKVGLYSVGGPANKKYVVISTYGGAGVSAAVDGTTIAKNSDTERGYYLESYEVGIGPADRNQTVLQIESRAPEAANNEGTYTSSTGFTIGASAGTEASLGAQYSQTNTGSIAIPDFAVRYTASTTQARWVYALAKVGNAQPYSKPDDLVEKTPVIGTATGKLLSLPGLASGQVLNPRNQAVWSIGGNYQGTMSFTVEHQALFRRVKLSGNGFTYTVSTNRLDGPRMSATFPVDFSLVNYAGDLSVARSDIWIAPDPALPPGYVWLQALVRSQYADYDGVAVSFANESGAQPAPIGSTTTSIGTVAGEVRRGMALARVPWNITNLPGTQTISVKVAPQGGELATENNSVTRPVNLTQPQVQVSESVLSLREGGASDSYTVKLSTQPSANVTIGIVTDGQVGANPPALIFTPTNWNTPQSVTIGAVDDSRVEGTQVSQIRHTASGDDATYGGMGVSSISATIADNDNASPNALTLTEGARSSYLYALNRAPAATVVISMTNDGGLQLSPATLTFTPASWNIPQTVVVRASGDAIAQGDRAVSIQHRAISADGSYSGALLAPVAVNIRDDDGPSPTITVDTAADTLAADGACSLREAIEAANTNASVFDCAANPASYHVIELAAAGPYSLSRQNDPAFPYDASLTVTSALIVNGHGAVIRNGTTTDSNLSRLFKVEAPGDLTLRDLTLRDGRANNAGALWVFAGACANLQRVIVTNNTAVGDTYGGGIVNQGALNIEDSTIADNTANGNNVLNQLGGGGILNEGDLNIANSTIANNRAAMSGGGLDNNSGRAWLTNTTITGNLADSDGDGNGEGGGISVAAGAVLLKNSVVAGNADTPGNAGPSANAPDMTRKTFSATQVFFGQILSRGGNIVGNVGSFAFDQNSVGDLYGDPVGTTTPNLGAVESAITVDPKLGAQSGSPPAYSLAPGSPAIDRIAAIDCTYASGPANALFLDEQPVASDQRGAVRPRGLRCDSGATELDQPGVGLTVTAIEVPTGRFGSVYQVVLNTQPASDVTIDLASAGGVTVTPNRLVFTPLNWNVPQTVTVLARPGAGLGGPALLSGAPVGTITHQVRSADPAYGGKALASVSAAVLVVPTNSAGTSLFIPVAQRP